MCISVCVCMYVCMYKTKMHSKVWLKVHSNLRFGFKNYSALVGRMVNKEISISF